jgi:hypothetical protein
MATRFGDGALDGSAGIAGGEAFVPIGEDGARLLLRELCCAPGELESWQGWTGPPSHDAHAKGWITSGRVLFLLSIAVACFISGISAHTAGESASLAGPRTRSVELTIPGARGQMTGRKDAMRIQDRAAFVSLAVALSGTVGAEAQVAPIQWRTDAGGNGHWYGGYVGNNPSWSQARAAAMSLGGDLVSYTDLAESTWVYANVASKTSLWNNRMGPWIGLYQPPGTQEPSGGWVWCDGRPLTWAIWGPDHPVTGWGGGPECDFAKYISWPPGPMNQWGADSDVHHPPYHFEANKSWVVEWSADCNNDGIVDYGQCKDGSLPDANGNNVPDCCEGGNRCIDCRDCDLNPNGTVDGSDLGALLAFWGPVSPAFPRADINGDGQVSGADLGLLLSNWGTCPQ